ncbi:MAG: Cna B-type domain-containing protein, partial [Clostridia bacterium]|nr:Cna B-type domain-containing protein [Clostridia bacterium]
NGTEVALNAANGWSATVNDLPKYANGQEIVYTWTEGAMPEGYELTNTSKDGTVTTLTNSYAPETTSATVKKVWDDANNQDGKRPAELKVTLSNGTEVTLNAANNWSATVNNLPKYANGQEITYTWTEGTMPEGYELTDTSKNGTVTTLTNSYAPETTSATVKKVWDDANNQDGKRPAELKVTLSNGTEVALNATNNWSATVNDLPKYANGTEITYTWTEGTMPEGYELTDTSKDGTVTTLTNSYAPEKTSTTVKKVWDDANNQDGKRPDTLKVTLGNGEEPVAAPCILNEENGWTATINNLPKYADGQEIAYTWTEGAMPEGYELTDTSKNGTVTTLTNSYAPEKTSATVKKVWDDANNQDGKRPAELKVTLSNGTEVALSAANGWTATVENLPKYANGTEITYTWTEGTMPEGYELTDTSKDGTVTTLTNSYAPEKTSATVKKVWDDADNQDGKRPAELKVTLSNGTEVALNATNNWSATVNDMPKYANGQEIVYTWTEGAMPEGYELTDTSKTGTVTTLTNTRKVEKTSVSGSKTWVGDTEDMRPESITINLLADGVVLESKRVNAADGWKWTFAELDKYKAGQEIIYTITEDAISYYQTEVNGYDVINTRKEVDGKSFPVTKKIEMVGSVAPAAGTYTFDFTVTARKPAATFGLLRSRKVVPNNSVTLQIGSGEEKTVAFGEPVSFSIDVEVTHDGAVWSATQEIAFWINEEDAQGVTFEVVETGDAPRFWSYDNAPQTVTQDNLALGAVVVNKYNEGYITKSFPITKQVVNEGDIFPGVKTFYFAVKPLYKDEENNFAEIESENKWAVVEVVGNTVTDYQNGTFAVTLNGVGTADAEIRITYPESVAMIGANVYELTSLDESLTMEELYAMGWKYDGTAEVTDQNSDAPRHKYYWSYIFEDEKIVNPDGQDAERIVFVNTHIATKPIPQTGDSGSIALWCALMSVSTLCLVILSRRRRA